MIKHILKYEFNLEDVIAESKFYESDDYIEYLENINKNYPYDFLIEENLQDIIEYTYEKHFYKKYNYLNYYLEEGARKFIKDIEDSYWSNKLDTYELYNDYRFIEWLTAKYVIKAYDKYIESLDLDYYYLLYR